MRDLKEKKKFSLIERMKSTTHAWRGMRIFFLTTHSAWIQTFFGILAIYLGFVLKISNTEWALITISIGFVIVAEAFNTAIEIDIDLTSPTYHPYAKDTKDVAAGAVLLSVIVACVVGLLVFLPKILIML